MGFLNKQIEHLSKKSKKGSLVRKQISCGIFQEMDVTYEKSPPTEREEQ